MPVDEIPLKGAHNVENVLAAVCAARLAGVPAERSARPSKTSRPSSTGWNTSPPSTASSSTTTPRRPTWMPPMKAIAAFPGGIHLILGGKDKNSDYRTLSPLLRARVKAVYTIGSAAAEDRVATCAEW